LANLSVRDLRVRYGKTEILRGVSFDLEQGQIVALLGANGSGKSTALNAVSGFVKPHSGSIRLNSTEIGGLPTHQIFRRGVVQISQARNLFPDMSVAENLSLGMANCPRGIDRTERMRQAYEWFPKLWPKRHLRAQALSGGEQQMIAIGRALVSDPTLILLDEPSGGLAPRVVDEIAEMLIKLKAAKHTMLIVEQNIALARSVADRFYILREGEVIDGDSVVNGARSMEEIVRAVYL
jgi:branched-chain amino acid transport system ATP-binding protein